MGVTALRELIPSKCKKTLELKSLSNKSVALDAYNTLYQFLAAIRGEDGRPLMDSKGRVTSHLSGLFYRTINMLENGIKVAYVFDGAPPKLKTREIERRQKLKQEAEKKYEEAVRRGDVEEARKYAQMSAKLTKEMVEEAKRLLEAMGVPWVQAPSEGEAQAAYMAAKGDVWASASQDYDSLLFGSPRLVRNLAVSGRRKLPNKNVYVEVKPEEITLKCVLEELGITREQLVAIAVLIGTDYTPGVKGVGPKTALRYVKSYGDLERVLTALGVDDKELYLEAYNFFLNPQVTDDYELVWRRPDPQKIIEILVYEHDFNEERVRKAIERLMKAWKEKLSTKQSTLDMFFKKR
ncbi:flap endonuclease-1 [Ignicoccus hospitalis]|uniref:Flap endonuclease 1 n=1 Tax=Ignicoccus hospitalis (strain KIN4/I / DSM 18386 / JCM 14125) TaxID=453591 RepID=FEN_IGNH4|nr:flap endonuclease-1 [Ignicoccus hospitalis]A8AAC1.1 RecName: Full=Flap endonuclease 1; Short=FEN-1; AltName: Full=Flap structure-specific endonuclease 1 [Ignicoccus hospitalis KIN4/I]ABU81873.1 flap endonuclease 1 [Ignicoccus hospitalis KIN4/I]HIH90141.1 flap endonuclease-1 [Desulfurococcaceae archaeon]